MLDQIQESLKLEPTLTDLVHDPVGGRMNLHVLEM